MQMGHFQSDLRSSVYVKTIAKRRSKVWEQGGLR